MLTKIIDRFPQIARFLRDKRDAFHINKVPKKNKLDFKLIGNKLMESGFFEPEETQLIKNILPKFDVFINIGANIGYYVCLACSMGIKSVAFEPIYLNTQYLMKNLLANNWGDMVEVFPFALSSKASILKIYGGGTGASLLKGWAGVSEEYYSLVSCHTFDSILDKKYEKKRTLVLVDVEGAELEVLKGSINLLKQTLKPVWIIEICIDQNQPKKESINPQLLETFDLFWDNGYKAYSATSPNRMINRGEIIEIMENKINTLETYNFIFLDIGTSLDEIINFACS